jgi:hypothetical protein
MRNSPRCSRFKLLPEPADDCSSAFTPPLAELVDFAALMLLEPGDACYSAFTRRLTNCWCSFMLAFDILILSLQHSFYCGLAAVLHAAT